MIAQGTAALAAEPWVRNKRYSNPAEWRGGIMRGVSIYDDFAIETMEINTLRYLATLYATPPSGGVPFYYHYNPRFRC